MVILPRNKKPREGDKESNKVEYNVKFSRNKHSNCSQMQPNLESTLYTGCLNMLCQTSNHLLGIRNTLLSHKNGICIFMRCGNLTYDPWIWLKVTSTASTASNRKSAKNP